MTTKNEDFSGDLSEYTQLSATAAAISGGQLVGTAAASTGIYHSAGSYGNDQSAEVPVKSVAGSYYYSALVRVNFTAPGNYSAYRGTIGVSAGDAYLEKVTAGSGSDIQTPGSIGRALLATDVITVGVVGTTVTLYLNGSPVLSASDGDIASGKPGVEMFSNGAVDDVVFQDSADSTAPVLTSPTGTQTGSTTANVGATTDEDNGTMYAVVTTSNTQPSVAQIKAGEDHTGAAAAWDGTQAIGSTGAKTLNATGLTPSTAYYAHLVHTDAAANDSNRVTSAQFTTAAATPSVSGVSDETPARGASITISGSNFGAAQGAGGVTIDGEAQTVTAWGASSITITVVRGATTAYGVAVDLVVTTDAAGAASPFELTGLQPQAGWSFVNATAPNADPDAILDASPAIASGDQIAWETVGGDVEVFADSTFSSADGVAEFDFEVWTPGDGWGTPATQTIAGAVGNSLEMSYAVEAVVGASLAMAYAVEAAVGASLTMGYLVGDVVAGHGRGRRVGIRIGISL